MWRSRQRAGLRFARPVDLAKWMPHGGQGQARVDRVISETRAELDARKQATASLDILNRDQLHQRIAEELALVARRLEGLSGDLSGDPAMIGRHAARLQEIDVSVLTLVDVGRLLTADPSEALRTIGMADPRRRLDRAARL
jgi:hypothetical protein